VADQVSDQHQLLLPHRQASSHKTLSAKQKANRHCEGMRQPRITQTEMVWSNYIWRELGLLKYLAGPKTAVSVEAHHIIVNLCMRMQLCMIFVDVFLAFCITYKKTAHAWFSQLLCVCRQVLGRGVEQCVVWWFQSWSTEETWQTAVVWPCIWATVP